MPERRRHDPIEPAASSIGARRNGQGLALSGVILGLFLAEATAADNFLILVADDVGVDKIGAYRDGECIAGECPSPPPTPNIDALAASGVLFRNAWAHPVCSPTRVGLLTGRDAHRTGVGNIIADQANELGLDLAAPNFASILGAQGYDTAAFGKWHMTGCVTQNGACTGVADDRDTHAIRAGFDYFLETRASPSYCDYRKVIAQRTGPGPQDIAVQVFPHFDTYAPKQTTDAAIAHIPQMTEPWLAYVAFNLAHAPFHDVPANPVGCTETATGTAVERYDAMTSYLDSEIGRLLAALAASSDVLDRTTIVFLGDNGTPKLATVPPFIADQSKATPYEGGINVPLLVSGPQVPLASAGGESTALVKSEDVFATLMDIAALDPCAAGGCGEDSESLLPYLQDPGIASLRTVVYAERFWPNTRAYPDVIRRMARNDRHKLVFRNQQISAGPRLYDLVADPLETIDLLDAPLTPEASSAFDVLANELNQRHGTCLASDDTDGDCVVDTVDNCPGAANGLLESALCRGNQLDSDGDGLGDACDDLLGPATFARVDAFACNFEEVAAGLDLEAYPGGTILSGTTVPAPTPIPGVEIDVTLPPGLTDVVPPIGGALDLKVVANTGDHPTLSEPNALGVDDAARADRIAAGTLVPIGFATPLVAFGLHVVVPGEPGVDVLDGALVLEVPGAPDALLRTANATWVGQASGVDHYAYFLGAIPGSSFSQVDLGPGAATANDAFFYTLDDWIPVPEAEPLLLWGAGLAGLGLAARSRVSRRR